MFSKKTLLGLIIATLGFFGLGVFLSGSAQAATQTCGHVCTNVNARYSVVLTREGYTCVRTSPVDTTYAAVCYDNLRAYVAWKIQQGKVLHSSSILMNHQPIGLKKPTGRAR